MTETSCQFVARIIPAHLFSKEHTMSTKFGMIIIRNLRAFRVE